MTYSVHVWDDDGIGREVKGFVSRSGAVRYATRHGSEYDGGLYVRRPDGVVIIGDGSYMRDGKGCDARGRPLRY